MNWGSIDREDNLKRAKVWSHRSPRNRLFTPPPVEGYIHFPRDSEIPLLRDGDTEHAFAFNCEVQFVV